MTIATNPFARCSLFRFSRPNYGHGENTPQIKKELVEISSLLHYCNSTISTVSARGSPDGILTILILKFL